MQPKRAPVLTGPHWSCHTVGMAPRDYARLATAARKRRLELGLALTDASAKAGGTSKGTWQRVERGEGIRDSNYAKIDGLLQWAPGSCMAVLTGGDPVSAVPVDGAPGVVVSDIDPEVAEARGREIVQLAAIATTDGLTSDQIRALSERAIADLRKAGLI